MSRIKCKECGDLLVDAVGNINSPILIIGDYPDFEDIRQGRCLSGDSKNILRDELVRVGIQLSSVRYTNVWQHGRKNEKTPKKEGCIFSTHVDKAFKEIQGKKYVLVMGSDASQALFGLNAMDICALRMKHDLFPKVIFYVAPNPASLYGSGVGEFRLSLSRFAQEMEK